MVRLLEPLHDPGPAGKLAARLARRLDYYVPGVHDGVCLLYSLHHHRRAVQGLFQKGAHSAVVRFFSTRSNIKIPPNFRDLTINLHV